MSPEQDQCPENPDHLNEPTDELRMLNERLLQENEMLRSQINKFLIHPPSLNVPLPHHLQYNVAKEPRTHSESDPALIGYWEFDREMNILDVSGTYCSISGYEREELLQMNVLDLDVFVSNTALVGMLEFLLNESAIRYQTVHRRKDGTYWEVEVYARFQDAEKEVFHAFFRDISPEKKQAQVFENYKNLFHTLLHASQDLIWIKDTHGTYQLCNDKFAVLVGFSAEEIIGKKDADLFPESLVDQYRQYDKIVIDSCQSQTQEVTYLLSSDNRVHYFETTRIPLLTPENQTQSILGVAKDITAFRQTSETLLRHDATLKDVLHAAKLGYLEYDFGTKTFSVSEEIRSLSGADETFQFNSPHDLLQLVYANDQPMVSVCLNLALVSQKPFDIIHRIQKPDKTLLYFEHRCKPEYNSSGKLLRALGTLRDITQEQEQKKKIFQLSTAIEQTTDTIFITNLEGEIEYFNASMQNSYGFTPEELLGSNPRILKSGLREESFYETLWNTILSGESFRAEFINKRKDGSFVFEDRNITPLKNLTGEVFGFLSVGRDYTEKKLAEIKLNKSERKFSHILKTALDGFMIHDIRGNILEANDTYCQMSGYTRNELLAMNINKLIRASGKEEITDLIDRILIAGQARFEAVHQRKDGSLFIVEESALVNEYDEKNVILFLKDITEKKRVMKDLIEAKESAEQMNKLKSSFLANMSHELRTPLIGIIGFSEIMQTSAPDEDTKEMAQIIFNSGQRLLRTFNLILDISRIESENARLKIEAFSLQTILQNCLKSYESKIQEKGLELKISVPEEAVTVFTDQNLLEQILSNLIDNAYRFTNKGSVSISIFSPDRRKVCISVADTGIGIDPEARSVIFDEFRQGSEGLNRAYEGTGLGLSLVKKYINLLGGEIWVESTPGVGSNFTISLPVDKSTTDQVNELTTEKLVLDSSPLAVVHASGSLLIISDDPTIMSNIEEQPEDDIHIFLAGNVDQGLQVLSENHCSLILIDIDLPDNRTNLDRIKLLHENLQEDSAYIVALVDDALDMGVELFVQIGYSDMIAKPLSMSKLKMLLGRHPTKKIQSGK